MFQLSFFIESTDSANSIRIASRAIGQFSKEITGYNVVSAESYWKVDGWYKVICDIETNAPLSREKAMELTSLISDKWEWDEAGSSAHSSAREMVANFCDETIKFASCWFEDLE